MKREFAFLLGVLMISGALGAITLSEPDALYNLGDRLYVSLEGVRGASSGNLNVDLICEGVRTNLVKIPARAFAADKDQSYSLPYKILNKEDLEIENLTDVLGDCQVVASLGSSVVSSKSFVVSNDVSLVVSLDKSSYNPGEEVKFSVDAVKANGKKLDGFVRVSGIGSFERAVSEGVAADSFVLSETLEAGNYNLNVSVWDVDSSGVLNFGNKVYSLDVAQVPRSLVVSLEDLTTRPGEDFEIGIDVFDQSGVEMNGVVALKISSPDGEVIEASLNSGEVGKIAFPSNASAGTWKVIVSFGDLVEAREFEMEAFQKVEFDLIDSILTVRNVGNVLYNKSISVEIGGEIMKLDLNIKVGEERKFNLDAPTGEYEIVVGDGETSFSKNTLLTGNAVSIEDLKNFSIIKDYSLIWIFLIVVLILVVVLLFVRFRKTKTLGDEGMIDKVGQVGNGIKDKIIGRVPSQVRGHVEDSLNFTKKSPAVNGLDDSYHVAEDKTMVDFTSKMGVSAESSLVLKGDKLPSAVVAISIKNYASLSEDAMASLQKTVMDSKGKGLIDWRGDYVFVVFSPIITRTYSNEVLAVKSAMSIVNGLAIHNKKFRNKVSFGLGVHSGELVASRDGKKLKYTSIGNTISFAKRISDSDFGKVVVSDDVRKKLIRDLKVSKGKDIGEKTTFVVEEVKDRSGNEQKLKELLGRNKG